MRIKKPKEKIGYYCDICSKKISKYKLDFDANGGIIFHKKLLCFQCRKSIAIKIIKDT